jgi:hypothetical protein
MKVSSPFDVSVLSLSWSLARCVQCRESGDHGPLNSWDRQPFSMEVGALPVPVSKGKTVFCPATFVIGMIALPRQARDKHRESTQQKNTTVYLCRHLPRLIATLYLLTIKVMFECFPYVCPEPVLAKRSRPTSKESCSR